MENENIADEQERIFKKLQREGMLMLLETADKAFLNITEEQEDKEMVNLTKKICGAYKACIVKTIEVNTQ